MLFTPLSDVTLKYGANQSFTALEWEDEEQFAVVTSVSGGILPLKSTNRKIQNLPNHSP